MPFELRPYQETAVSSVINAYEEGKDSALVVLPTGLGKTVIFSTITQRMLTTHPNLRFLMLAHRNTLLKQAHDKLKAVTGIDASFESAALAKESGNDSRVIISSVQTMHSRIDSISAQDFDVVIIDEAHHIASKTYCDVLETVQPKFVIGVTATPVRGDKTDIQDVFDTVASQYTTWEAIRDGWLSPLTVETIPLKIDISGARLSAGDFSSSDIGAAVDPYIDSIAKEVAKRAQGRKTLVFTPLVETSKKMAQALTDAGLNADWVAGERSDSETVQETFENGGIDALNNSLLLTEGYDYPAADCLVNLRATKSEALYTQIMGRVLRLSPETGKKDALVLDFLWQDNGRGALSVTDAIFADESEDIKEAAKDLIRGSSDPVSLEDALEKAKSAAEERMKARIAEGEANLMAALQSYENKRAHRIAAMAFMKHSLTYPHKSLKTTLNGTTCFEILYDEKGSDPSICMGSPKLTPKDDATLKMLGLRWIPISELYDAFGDQSWALEPATPAQLAFIEKSGIPLSQCAFKGQASTIIDTLVTRRKLGLASYKQLRVLHTSKAPNTDLLLAKEAKALIDIIASKKSWAKVPAEVEEKIDTITTRRRPHA